MDYRAQAEAFAEYLITLPKTRRRVGDKVTGRCPLDAHEDKHPSFGYDVEKDAWACSCGGGKGSELMKALGWTWSQATKKQDEVFHPKTPTKKTEYLITNPKGDLVATHIRWDKPDGGKSFTWEVNGKSGLNGTSSKDLPLYGICEATKKADSFVFLCEGEKAADALNQRGLTAVATVCGAQTQPSVTVLGTLKDKYVVLWPDNDEPGHKHMEGIAKVLTSLKIAWEMVVWPDADEKEDAYDYFERGGTPEGIMAMAKGPPTFDEIVGAKSTPMSELAHLIDAEIDYAIYPICPKGTLTMIQGMPKGGKSTFSVWLSLCAANGNWPSGVFEIKRPLNVLFVEYEDRPILVVKRASKYLAGAGMNPKVLPANLILSDNPTLWLDSPKYEELLKAEIKARQYDIVIIDTLSYIHQAESENDAADMKVLTASLKRIVADTGCNITFLHHVGKGSKEKSVSEAARGSSVIPACADVILHWGDRGESDITPVSITSKYDDGFRCSVEYLRKEDGAVEWRVQKDLGDDSKAADGQRVVYGMVVQIEATTGKPARTSSIVAALADSDIPKSTVMRHLKKLVDACQLRKIVDEKGVFYTSIPA